MNTLKRFKRSEKGQGLVEYGLILALISVVAVGSLTGVGDRVTDTFNHVVHEGGKYTDAEIGEMIVDGYIPLSTPDELDSIRNNEKQTFGKNTPWEEEYLSDSNGRYIQVANINLRDYEWDPIESFSGTYDGNGFVISNLHLDNNRSHQGLFGRLVGASISHLTLDNVDIKGHSFIGGLAGRADDSIIYSTHVIGDVVGSHGCLGGLFGYMAGGNISNSSAIGDVISLGEGLTEGQRWKVGGMTGMVYKGAKIEKSYSKGYVVGAGTRVGGLVGESYIDGYISDSYAIGHVQSNSSYSGGLVGFNNHDSTIKNSYSFEESGKRLVGLNRAGSSITNSYFELPKTNEGYDSLLGVGLSSSAMKDSNSYDGWDFNSVWQIQDGQYPTLQW